MNDLIVIGGAVLVWVLLLWCLGRGAPRTGTCGRCGHMEALHGGTWGCEAAIVESSGRELVCGCR